jgi:hypothetical protein
MKVSLFVVYLVGSGLLALSTASPAPFGGHFHLANGNGSRMGRSTGIGHRVFIGRGTHAGPAFRRNNRFFFRRPAFNVVTFGFPVWYPNYYSYPDDNLDNDNNSYQPGDDYQYWNDSAVGQQSDPAQRANYNAPIATVTGAVRPPPTGPGYGGNVYISNGAGGQVRIVTPEPPKPNETTADPPFVPPSPPETKGDAVEKFVLVSWLKDAGKDVIFVKNTETDDVQRITSEPNKDQFQIVAIHPNPDPKLFEAVISDGKEQRTVKFHFAAPAVLKTVKN